MILPIIGRSSLSDGAETGWCLSARACWCSLIGGWGGRRQKLVVERGVGREVE